MSGGTASREKRRLSTRRGLSWRAKFRSKHLDWRSKHRLPLVLKGTLFVFMFFLVSAPPCPVCVRKNAAAVWGKGKTLGQCSWLLPVQATDSLVKQRKRLVVEVSVQFFPSAVPLFIQKFWWKRGGVFFPLSFYFSRLNVNQMWSPESGMSLNLQATEERSSETDGRM